MGERTGTWDSEFRGPLKSRLMWKRPSRLLFVCILSLFLTRRHRGAPRKHVACAWLQTITKHDIVAPAGAAEVTKHVRGEQAAWAAIGDEAAALGRRSALPPAPPTAAAATTCGDWLGSQHRTRLISAGISSSTRTVDGGECTSESGVVPSGIGPRFAERTERFCGGMRYLWRIRSHVQAVPHCPYARQRYHHRAVRYVLPPPQLSSWRRPVHSRRHGGDNVGRHTDSGTAWTCDRMRRKYRMPPQKRSALCKSRPYARGHHTACTCTLSPRCALCSALLSPG